MILNDPLFQIIISLIILLLMGFFAYNIYLIEFEKMLKGSNDIRKEITVFKGIYDFHTSNEARYETYDKSKLNFLDINPSINQQGGAEYSYNFWLYVNKNDLNDSYGIKSEIDKRDVILFIKGEKKLYHNPKNYNCSGKWRGKENHFNVMIKTPLVRLKHDGSSIVVEYNNIYTTDSFKYRSKYAECTTIDNGTDWNNKNSNLLGVYDLNFDKKWFMVTVVYKEVADSNNIMIKNRASCKMYVNGVNVLDKKVETKYGNAIYSATSKNNKSPLFVNPSFNHLKDHNDFFANSILKDDAVKMSDLKYFNYSLTQQEVHQLYMNGFSKYPAVVLKKEETRYDLVSSTEMEMNEIKEI